MKTLVATLGPEDYPIHLHLTEEEAVTVHDALVKLGSFEAQEIADALSEVLP